MRPLNRIFCEHLRRFGTALVVWLAIAIITAPRCSAQVSGTLEISPIVGSYIPAGQLPTETPSGCIELVPGACSRVRSLSLSRERNPAIALGGRITAWVSQRIAVEGSLWYAPSHVPALVVDPLDKPFFSPAQLSGGPAHVVAGNVRLLVGVTPRAGTWAYLVAGPAFVGRFGDAYAGYTGTSRLGGVVGAGAHLRVARSLAVRAELEDYVYAFQGYHEHDLFVSLGLSLASRIGSAVTP